MDRQAAGADLLKGENTTVDDLMKYDTIVYAAGCTQWGSTGSG
jgi:hypothetical protein